MYCRVSLDRVDTAVGWAPPTTLCCIEYLRSDEETIRLGKGAFSHPDDPVPADVPDELVQTILAARPRARH